MSSKTPSKPMKDKNKVHTDTKLQLTDASRVTHLSSDLDNETMKKIDEICFFTNRSKEEAYIALQDFNGDTNQAAEYLLENYEWQEMKKKKRPQNSSIQPPGNTNSSSPNDQKQFSGEGDNTESPFSIVEASGRGRKENKSGPRLRRGRGQQNGSMSRDRNDDNQNDSQERNTFNRSDRGYRDERSLEFDSSRGRRSRGQSGGNRRGGRGNRGSGFHSNVDSGSTNNVDMWNNSLAENGKMETITTWGDTQEDWNADAWEGSLEESLVLTRTSTASSTQYNPSLNHRQHKTFQTSPNVYHSAQDHNTGNQQTDYNPDYLKQYNQEATMRIKSAVGIGVEPSTSIYGQRQDIVGLDNRLSRSSYQNAPSQRSLPPPPSRIPQSAVEMPGSMNQLKLDVQFGNWDSSFTGGQAPSASDNMDSSLYSNANNRRPDNRITGGGGGHNHAPSSSNSQLDLTLEALRLNAHSDSLRLNQETMRNINSQQHPDAAMFHDESILESKHSIEKVTSQSNARLPASSNLGQAQNSQYPFDASAYSTSSDNKRVNTGDTTLNHYYDSMNEYQQYDSVPRSFKATGSSSARELSTNIPIKFEGPMSARDYPAPTPITTATKQDSINIENPSVYSMYQGSNSAANNYLRSSLSTQSDPSVTMTTPSLATTNNQAGNSQGGANLNTSNQPSSVNSQNIPVSMTMHQSAGFHGYGTGANYAGEMYAMGLRGQQQGIQGVNKLGNQLANPLHIHQQMPAFQMNNLYGQMNPNMYRSSDFDSLYNNNNRQQRSTDNATGQQFNSSTEQQVTNQNANFYALSSNNVPASKTQSSSVLSNTQSTQNAQQQSNLNTQGLNTQGLNAQQSALNPQAFNAQSLNTPQSILNSQALNTQGNLSTSQGALNLQQGNLNGQGLNTQLGGLSASGLAGGLNMASTKTSNVTTSTGSKLSAPNQLNQMLNPNYVVNQPPGFHMTAYHGYPHAQQAISGYTYEDLQQLQQPRFPASQAYSMHTAPSGASYYDMAFQQGREGNSLQTQTFTSQLDSKLGQLDNSVSGSMGSGLPTSTNQQQFHLNPHYGYYYPGNIVPVQSYYPAVIPMGGMAVPVATNQNTPQHAGSSTQFQNKQNQFASHNFNIGGQSGQDFGKNLGQQVPNNIKTNSSLVNQAASVASQDSTAVANSATHTKQVQNSSFHHVGGGVQGASQGVGTQGSSVGVFNAQSYMPLVQAGLQQESGRSGGAQANIGQPMKLASKSYGSQYWPAN